MNNKKLLKQILFTVSSILNKTKAKGWLPLAFTFSYGGCDNEYLPMSKLV